MAAAEGPGGPGEGLDAGQACIADSDRLEAFACLPAVERPSLDAALRGVLAETALTNAQRFEWRLLAPLLHRLVDTVLADFEQLQEAGAEGPPRPPPAGYESVEALGQRLHSLLDGHDAAPFTLQRLCEVLLEPRKQYARLDKVALAVEKLLMVTSTRQPDRPLPPPPALATLAGINDNPKSPYLDGRPPQVLDPQQHQALLQQQAQALAAAQQHHQQLRQQQQQGPQLGGLPNGLEEPGRGGQAPEAANGRPEPAGAAPTPSAEEAEAMRAEAAAFVEAALADASPDHGALGGSGVPGASEGERRQRQGAAARSPEPAEVPPTPPGQRQPASPGGSGAQEEQQKQGQAAGAAGATAMQDAAGPASMDIDPSPEHAEAAAAQQHKESATVQQPGVDPAAASTAPGPDAAADAGTAEG